MNSDAIGTLYVVATPIGNRDDITYRAEKILKSVATILCEDTRTSKKLLEKYEIQTPLISYHAHSGVSKSNKIIELLKEGKDLALITDAGTPAISDPGVLLVAQIREAFGENAKVVTIPGPSAVVAALSISGIPSSEYTFLGFLPHKKGRETLFTEIQAMKRTAVFYESPHRILKTLESLNEKIADTRTVVVARELTKIYEQIVSGTPKYVLEYFTNHPDKVRGEFVVIVSA